MNAIKKTSPHTHWNTRKKVSGSIVTAMTLELGSLFLDDGESSYTFDRLDYIALENFIKKHKGQSKVPHRI